MVTKIVAVFKNGNNRAVRLPKDIDFEGVNELEISREGNRIILRPVKPNWLSLRDEDKADKDFLLEREDVIEDGRIVL
ncbi:type II toxin-antitoxin system VapB family antitoxin [Providencia sp. PROV188]|jgi:antitoxin VapB|uniref:type II toxin-antitoxin system VapB family antitoxin n=1 Tax=Providencia TaxID=586 RepID=UPI0003E29AB9|nr:MULTISPECIES: type II toxin-antitoxin system VapB family antitoxin [Providencia]ETT02908.1 antidote-toxin recognition MazE [Providencia alcalifaciens PAL-3]EUC98927.1 antidote-toxin recognition MazE [Providencia alcalifaciens PAL-1]MBC5792037.1 AbrB/MazE/SpoVT family DNA-binding domain-containing protein [Providencia sp. JUb39]MBG5883720.1 AbrB/MazE/SpoVT family DNA-binding domain-containing protein [Providencia alcalifaciens]MBS0923868.1 AbrB/MazE/SpoVT family DNA-binding domain-containing